MTVTPTSELMDIVTGAKNRRDVVNAYKNALLLYAAGVDIDWPAINRAIVGKWSRSALIWIKEQAWK